MPIDPIASAKKTVGKRKASEKVEAPAAAHDAKRSCLPKSIARATVPKPPKQPRLARVPIVVQTPVNEDLVSSTPPPRISGRAKSISSRLDGFSNVPVLPYV